MSEFLHTIEDSEKEDIVTEKGVAKILKRAEETEKRFLQKFLFIVHKEKVIDLLELLDSNNKDLFYFIKDKTIPILWLQKMFADDVNSEIFTKIIEEYYGLNVNKKDNILTLKISPEKREQFLIGLQGVLGAKDRRAFIRKIGIGYAKKDLMEGDTISGQELYVIGKKNIEKFIENGLITASLVDLLIWNSKEEGVRFLNRWCSIKGNKDINNKNGKKAFVEKEVEQKNIKKTTKDSIEKELLRIVAPKEFIEYLQDIKNIMEWVWSLVVTEVGKKEAKEIKFLRNDFFVGALIRNFSEYSFEIKEGNVDILRVINKKNRKFFEISLNNILNIKN